MIQQLKDLKGSHKAVLAGVGIVATAVTFWAVGASEDDDSLPQAEPSVAASEGGASETSDSTGTPVPNVSATGSAVVGVDPETGVEIRQGTFSPSVQPTWPRVAAPDSGMEEGAAFEAQAKASALALSDMSDGAGDKWVESVKRAGDANESGLQDVQAIAALLADKSPSFGNADGGLSVSRADYQGVGPDGEVWVVQVVGSGELANVTYTWRLGVAEGRLVAVELL